MARARSDHADSRRPARQQKLPLAWQEGAGPETPRPPAADPAGVVEPAVEVTPAAPEPPPAPVAPEPAPESAPELEVSPVPAGTEAESTAVDVAAGAEAEAEAEAASAAVAAVSASAAAVEEGTPAAESQVSVPAAPEPASEPDAAPAAEGESRPSAASPAGVAPAAVPVEVPAPASATAPKPIPASARKARAGAAAPKAVPAPVAAPAAAATSPRAETGGAGDLLLSARVDSGYSIGEASARTCIPRDIIEHLECSAYALLPQEYYCNAHIEKLCALYHIDAAPVLSRFREDMVAQRGEGQGLAQLRAVVTESESGARISYVLPGPGAGKPSRGLSPTGAIVSGVIVVFFLVVLAALAVMHYRRRAGGDAPTGPVSSQVGHPGPIELKEFMVPKQLNAYELPIPDK